MVQGLSNLHPLGTLVSGHSFPIQLHQRLFFNPVHVPSWCLWTGSIFWKLLLCSSCQFLVRFSLPSPFLNAQLPSWVSPPHHDGPAAPSFSLQTTLGALEPHLHSHLCNHQLPHAWHKTPGSRPPLSAPFSPCRSGSASHSVMSDSATSWTAAHQALLSMDSPGKNTGVGCHSLLQRIFPNQRSNLDLPHCRQILYYLSHQEAPSSLNPLLLCEAHFKHHNHPWALPYLCLSL